MGMAEEAMSLTALLEAASICAPSMVCTESSPENSVTENTSSHLAKP